MDANEEKPIRLIIKLSEPETEQDQQSIAMEKSVAPNHRWAADEVAFIINYTDISINQGTQYRETAPKLFREIFKQDVTISAINSKLGHVLRKCNQAVSVTDLIQNGTNYLELEKISDDLLEKMIAQRGKFNLPALTVERAPPFHEDMTGRNDYDTISQFLPRMTQSGRVSKALRDTTPEDTENTAEDPTDTDYTEAIPKSNTTTVKNRKESIAVHRTKMPNVGHIGGRAEKPAATKHSFTTETPPVVVHTSEAQDVDPNDQTADTHSMLSHVDAGPKPKRKSEAVEIIDTDSEGSPSKRRVVDESPAKTAKMPEIASSMVHVQNQERTNDMPRTPQKPFRHPPRRSDPVVSNHSPTSLPVSSTPEIQSFHKSVQGKLDDVGYLLRSLLEERMKGGKPFTPDMLHRMRSLGKIMEQDPGNLAAQLLRNFEATDAARLSLSKQFQTLIGRHEPGTKQVFPPIPPAQEIDHDWNAVHQGIKAAFTDDRGYIIKGKKLAVMPATYIAHTIDNLLSDPQTRKSLIQSVTVHLGSPHVAYSLMSGLFCCWLFKIPDLMCDGKHSDLTMSQYKTMALSSKCYFLHLASITDGAIGGSAEVQRMDKFGFSSLFADEKFQKSDFQKATDGLLQRVSDAIKSLPKLPGLDGIDDPEGWVQGALKLKQKLLISPRDYRIHFCLPTTTFDPTWMTAEDSEGRALTASEAASKNVAICLFPALIEQDPKPFKKGAEFTPYLVKNKNFFPTWQEKLKLDPNPKAVISKAVVLMV